MNFTFQYSHINVFIDYGFPKYSHINVFVDYGITPLENVNGYFIPLNQILYHNSRTLNLIRDFLRIKASNRVKIVQFYLYFRLKICLTLTILLCRICSKEVCIHYSILKQCSFRQIFLSCS